MVKKRKEIEAQNPKHPTRSRAADVLIGDEEQDGKRKEQRKKEGAGSQPSYPGLFGRSL